MLKAEWVAGFFDGEGSIGIYRNGQGVFHLRTQLTQNVNPTTEEILSELRDTYGGNLARMRSPIYRRSEAFNWQVNGTRAASFLVDILPHLRLKCEQAEVAIAWQSQHIPPGRDERGRMRPGARDAPLDIGVARLLKALKVAAMSEVMAAQSDLVEIVHTLKQIVCVKG